MVGVFNVQLLAELNKLINGLVGRGGAGQHEVVHHQVIAGAIAHQHIAVSVQDLAPGGLHAGPGGVGGGVVNHTAGFDDLKVIQTEREETQNGHEQKLDDTGTQLGQSFHVSPPIFSMKRKMGYSMGIRARESTPVMTAMPK